MTLEELSRLDYQGAMELLFACMTDLKRHEKDIDSLKQDLDLWNSRVLLADGKGLADLAAAARNQAGDLAARLAEIERSRAEIAQDISRLREALPRIKAKQRSIDPDLLLAEITLLSGGDADPEKARLERELEALDKGRPAGTAAQGSPSAPPGGAPSGGGAAPGGAVPGGEQAPEGTAAPIDDALAELKRKMGIEPGKKS